MAARVIVGLDFDTGEGFEPITKTDGLLWITPMGQLAIWYNGAWRPRGGGAGPLDPYPPPTQIPTPAWAAVAKVGSGLANPAPQTNGQLLFDTDTNRLRVWDNIGWLSLP